MGPQGEVCVDCAPACALQLASLLSKQDERKAIVRGGHCEAALAVVLKCKAKVCKVAMTALRAKMSWP